MLHALCYCQCLTCMLSGIFLCTCLSHSNAHRSLIPVSHASPAMAWLWGGCPAILFHTSKHGSRHLSWGDLSIKGPCDLPTSPSELQELNLHWLWVRGNFQFSLNVHWWVKLLQLFNGQREPKHMNDMTFLIRKELSPIEHECWWCRAKCVSWLLSGCGSMKWLAFGGLCVLSFPLKMMHWQELLWESAESHTEWCASWFLGSASRTKKLWPAHGWLAFSEQTGSPIVAHCLCS